VLIDELRLGGLTDPAVLACLAGVDRSLFLPPSLRHLAFENRPVAIGWDQTCPQPQIAGVMLQALEVAGGARVLEVGGGSGYLAALLRGMGAHELVTIELIPELAALCRHNLNLAGVESVEVRVGDGARGAPDRAPFDAVVISAAAEEVPPDLLAQVAQGGRLVAPLGPSREQRLWCLRRGPSGWQRTDLGPCRFVPLRA
jgi:protein-L-isoaspartate(D-aspartate) O-methyltransferase